MWLYDLDGSHLTDRRAAALHGLIVRLLQDDDESIRVESAKLVRSGLGLSRAVCQKRALELEWEYIGRRLGSGGDSLDFQKVIDEAILDKQNLGELPVDDRGVFS
jgi:hypothetical protein